MALELAIDDLPSDARHASRQGLQAFLAEGVLGHVQGLLKHPTLLRKPERLSEIL